MVGFLFHFCFDKKIKTNVVLEQTERRQVWNCAGGFLWSVFVLDFSPIPGAEDIGEGEIAVASGDPSLDPEIELP